MWFVIQSTFQQVVFFVLSLSLYNGIFIPTDTIKSEQQLHFTDESGRGDSKYIPCYEGISFCKTIIGLSEGRDFQSDGGSITTLFEKGHTSILFCRDPTFTGKATKITLPWRWWWQCWGTFFFYIKKDSCTFLCNISMGALFYYAATSENHHLCTNICGPLMLQGQVIHFQKELQDREDYLDHNKNVFMRAF